MSGRPSPERPGDQVPEPVEFAGWPPLGARSARLAAGPVDVGLSRLDQDALDSLERWVGEKYQLVHTYENLDAGQWLITVPFADTLCAIRSDTPHPDGWALAEVRFYEDCRCQGSPLVGLEISSHPETVSQ